MQRNTGMNKGSTKKIKEKSGARASRIGVKIIVNNFIQNLITSYPQLCYQQLVSIAVNRSNFSLGF